MKNLNHKIILIFLLATNFLFAQNSNLDDKNIDCSFSLSGVFNDEINLGSNVDEVLKKFDSFEKFELENLKFKDTIFYKVTKKVKLPITKKEVLMNGNLAFYKNSLYLINLKIPVTSDYNYLSVFKAEIKRNDSLKKYKFIYNNERSSNGIKNDKCKKLFFWGRSDDIDPKIYTFTLRVFAL